MSKPGEMGGSMGRKTGEKSNFSVTCSLLSQYLKEKGSFRDLSLGMACSFDAKGKPETPLTTNLLPGATNLPCDIPAKNRSRETFLDLNSVRTSDSFPQHHQFRKPAPVETAASKKPETPASQMTIFYGGKVFVFDNFPVEKANELMILATKGNNPPGTLQNPVNIPDRLTCQPPRNATPVSTSGNNPVPITISTTAATAVAPQDCPQRPAHLPIASDLPIARRVSLNRFLEKRKGRISSKAPYQVDISPDIGTSSGASSGKQEETPMLPAFHKSEATKPVLGNSEDICTLPVFGKPEEIPSMLAFGRPKETDVSLSFSKPEEKQLWLGLATPSSSDLPESERR